MKINRLTLSAFGPFKQEQVIDFKLLNEKQLFLITGPTGSGKTTIFDAISYALYGKSSGNGREGEDFISQYAKDEDLTFVELDFTLKGKHCVIRREPKQIRQKIRQSGVTIKNAVATLTIDDQVYATVSEVNQKIESLLGIDASQFRQIVMLPQGEFRQLLEANSSEKELIFRKIFKTDYYKLFQDQLRLKVKQLESLINDQKIQLGQEIRNIDPSDQEDLLNLINKEDLNYLEIIEKTKQINKELTNELENTALMIKTEKAQADELISQVNHTKLIQTKKGLLVEHSTEISRLEGIDIHKQEVLLNQLIQATFVRDVEKIWEKARAKNRETEISLTSKQKEYEACIEEQKTVEDAFAKILIKVETLDSLKASLQTLRLQKSKYQEWKDLTQEANNLSLSVQVKREKKSKQIEDLKQVKQEFEAFTTKREKVYQEVLTYQDVPIEFLKQKGKIEKLIETENLFLQIKASLKRHQKLQASYLLEEANYKNATALYELHQNTYLKSQAGILAVNLCENSACPVCGSTTHPNKAVLAESVLTSEALELEKAQLDQLTKDHHEGYNKVFTAFERLNDQIKQLRIALNLEVLDASQLDTQEANHQVALQAARELATQLATDEEKYKKAKSLSQTIELTLTKTNLSVQKLEENIKQLDLDFQTVHEQYLLVDNRCQQLQIEYDLSEQKEDFLLKNIMQLQTDIEIIERDHRIMSNQLNELNLLVTKSAAMIQSLTNQLQESKIEESEKEKEFNLRFSNANFHSLAEYQTCLKQIDHIQEIEEQIKTYYQDLNHHQKVIQSLEAELKDVIELDLEDLQARHRTCLARIDELGQFEKVHFATLQGNQRAVNKISLIFQKYSSKILEYNNSSYLEKIATGSNSLKLTFERYVLTVYFDEIILAANLRLKDMSVGRYLLQRDDEYTGGRGQQGLDLLVFDHYTNKKRPVKTLSGGESFIASLALALGLADVVSQFAGGIQLDTIFIDEGFGSLDPDALEHAIATLNKLRDTGRTVGIISHVQELRERIDAKIEILKTNEGSIAKIRL